jgi:RHS repeat-associated protein
LLFLFTGSVSNSGTCTAINGGYTEVSDGVSVDNSNGLLSADGGSSGLYDYGSISGGSFNLTNGATIYGSGTLSNFTNLAGSDLLIPGSTKTLTISGTVTDNGTIELKPNSSGGVVLAFSGNVTLTGTGEMLMDPEVGSNYVNTGPNAGSTVTNAAGHMVLGVGTGHYFGSGLAGTVINQGVLEGNAGGIEINSASFTNSGTVEALNAGWMEVGPGTSADNSSGQITADASSNLYNEGTITGGTFTLTNGSTLYNSYSNSGTITGSTFNFSGGSDLGGSSGTLTNITVPVGSDFIIAGSSIGTDQTMTGTLTDNGTTELQPTSSSGVVLAFSGNVTLTGTGTMQFDAEKSGYIVFVQAASSGSTLTNATGHTIDSVGAGYVGVADQGTVVNDGIMEAVGSGNYLDVKAALFTNDATWQASNGAQVIVGTGATVDNTNGQISADQATFYNQYSVTGGSISLSNQSLLVQDSSVTAASITGATLDLTGGAKLTGNGTLNGISVPAGSDLLLMPGGSGTTQTIAGTVTDNGTIEIDPTTANVGLAASGNVTLTGTGQLLVDAGGAAGGGSIYQCNYTIGSGSTLTDAAGFTTQVASGGQLSFFGGGTLVNQGLMESVAGCYLGTQTVTNAATLQASGGGYFHVNTTLDNSSGQIALDSGTLNNTGTITGGAINSTNGGTVTNGNGGGGDTITGSTFNLSSGSTLQGTGTINGIIVPTGSDLLITPSSSGTTQTIAGTVTDNGTIEIDPTTANVGLAASGNVTLTGTGQLLVDAGGAAGGGSIYQCNYTIESGSTLTDAAGFTTQVASGGQLSFFGGGTLVNQGLMESLAGFYFGTQTVTNAATLQASSGGYFHVNTTLDNSSGQIVLDSGTLNNTGAITGGAINGTNGSSVQGNGVLSNLTIPRGSYIQISASASQTLSGTVTINGAIVFQGSVTFPGTLINTGSAIFYQSTTLGSGSDQHTNNGLIGVVHGATVTVAGSTFTNESEGVITGGGSFNTNAVTFTNFNNPPKGGLYSNLPSVLDEEIQPSTIQVTYDSASGMNASTVTNTANYTVVGSGGDGDFGDGDDINEDGLISGITYNNTTGVATISFSQDLPSDFYQISINGSAVQDSNGNPIYPSGQVVVVRELGVVAAQTTVQLDPASDSGAPDHPAYTNVTTPTFDVQVNQAGTITLDYESNGQYVSTMSVQTAGIYKLTAPALTDGSYTATVAFASTSAGTAQSTTTYTIDTVGPNVTSFSPSGTLNNGVSQATVTFSEPVDANSFSSSTITLTGPGGTVAVSTPQLVSGSTYSISFPAQTVQGNYTLTIAPSVADYAANQMDQDQDGGGGQSDDGFTGSFTLALPDLAVTGTSSPSAAAEGTSIGVSWTVTDNDPNNPAPGPWTDGVYLSTNSVLDNTAIKLLSVAAPPQTPLGAGVSYTRNESITLPGNVATGNYYLLFATNIDSGQAESDAGSDTNNVVADPIALSAADLQVTGVSGPATGFAGQSLLVNWTDVNNGTAPATGPWVDNVYAATDAKGDNPTLLASFTFNGSLAVGVSVPLTQPVPLPQTPGTYWLEVTTNATQTVAEGTNYNNNTGIATSSIQVFPVPLPDLVVSSITPPPDNENSGMSVPISFVIKNQGTAPTSVPVWQDWVVVSQDSTLASSYNGYNDQALNNQPIVQGFNNPSYLDVGQSYQQNVNITLPISAQGTWYVYVVPDGLGSHHPPSMTETSRTDKIMMSKGFSVQLSPPPALAVTAVNAPSQDFSGQPMTVSWTVANNGTGPTAAGSWTDAVYMSMKNSLDSSATLLGRFAHQGVLAAGISYAQSESVNLPIGVSGSFYFLVQTDVYGQVFQNGNTANNVNATSSAETVNLTPPPDLTVPAFTVPTSGLSGHGLTFTYTVTNAGAGGTPNTSWTDAFYLSPTQTFNSSTAISLGQDTHQGALDAGASYTNTVTETIPNNLSNNYYVIVNTDSGNFVFQLHDGDKFGASSATVQITTAPPDLIVSSASGPGTALEGTAVVVGWTVTNQGGGDTAVSSWVDNVYADTSNTLDNNKVLLGSFTHNGLVNSGASYSQSQLVTLPISLVGAYNLFVVTNATGTVPESDTTNNTSAPVPVTISQQVTIQQGGQQITEVAQVADLQPTSMSAPATADTGASVTVTWTVQNNGPGTTNASYWYDDVWISNNATLGLAGATDVYLGTAQINNALASGASYSASGTFTVPNTLLAGSYYFIVAVNRSVAPPNDTNNNGVELAYETNYSNNEQAVSTTVSVAATPELSVSNVTAPSTATAGGQLAVNWTVTNSGAATGNVPITDSVYLSYDPVFDGPRYLTSVTTQGGLAAGASYNQSATIQLPSGVAGTFYVFVVTNSDHAIYELNPVNNTNYDPQSTQISLPPPADLVAGTVTIPASGTAGEDITITYQVNNNGSNAANGSWVDALYLSPTQTFEVTDPLLGHVYQTQDVASGGSYTGTLSAPLPGVAPGSYYVILRTNILDSYPELTLANNLSASLTQTAIDAPALTLGTAATGSLSAGQSAYYKVVVDAGQTLQFALATDQQHQTAANELYVSFGTMPTRSQANYRYSQAFAANQQITIPTTQAGSYYVLVYADSVPSGPETYSLTASLVPFSITAVNPGQVGTGMATIEIDGAKFDGGTTFQLLGPTGTVVNDQSIQLQDSSTAFVTFDLTSSPTGTYDVQATQADGATTKLSQALNVVTALPTNLQVYLSTPSGVLSGHPGVVTVTYANQGNTDLPAPLLALTSDNALLELPDQSSFNSSTVQFLGIGPRGPAGILAPGAQGSITISFQPTTTAVGTVINFTVLELPAADTAIDWASQQEALRPPTISDLAWGGIFANFTANVGSTVGSLQAALDADATYLSGLGEGTYDVGQLTAFEIEKANASYTAQTLATAVDDSLPAPGMDLTFERSFQQSIAGRYATGILGSGWTNNWDITSSTDASGNAIIEQDGITRLFLLQTNGSYRAQAGDHGQVTSSNGAFQLLESNGTLYLFNPNGTLQYVQDTHGNRITAGYSAAGQLVSLTHSSGASFTLSYNSQGRLASLVDSTGQTVTYSYDATGQFLTSCTNTSGTTTYSYVTGQSAQQNNALSAIAFADGTHLSFSYDSEGRLIDQQKDGGAGDQAFAYGSAGGYTVTNADGNATTILYDLFGATAETIDPLGHVTHYRFDAGRNLTEVNGLLGTTYRYTYDAHGNVTSETDPLGIKLTFTYDAANNLTSYTDGNGNKTQYAYNAANDLLSITYADGSQQQYTYNPLGEATQYLSARGHAINYTYNAAGLVTQEQFADGSSYTFTYDGRGNMLTATDANGTITFSYKNANNPDLLTAVAYPNGTSLSFAYNAVGQRTQSVDQSGFTVNYAYDSAGRLQELTDHNGNLIVQYTYDAAGQLIQKDMGNGTRTNYQYDAAGRVLQIVNLAPDHTTVNSFDDYTYDALGNVLTATSQDGQWTYTYDADGQLTQAVFASNNPSVLPNQNLQYVYDAAGNRLSETVNGVTTTYASNNLNQYTSATMNGATTTYQYDADGNLIAQTDSTGTTSYTFNDLNLLTAINGPATTASYSFDPLGNRRSQTVNGVTSNFLVDPSGLGSLVAAFDGGGNLQVHYTYGLGLTSQVDAAGNAAYYEFNVTGSTTGITNSSGQYANQYEYLPFGETVAATQSLSNPFAYVGQLGVSADGSGLLNMRARSYDPTVGRFLSRDPLGLSGGNANVQAYAFNDPILNVDPTGLNSGPSVFIGPSFGGAGWYVKIGVTANVLTGEEYFTVGAGLSVQPTLSLASVSTASASDGWSASATGSAGPASVSYSSGGPSAKVQPGASPNLGLNASGGVQYNYQYWAPPPQKHDPEIDKFAEDYGLSEVERRMLNRDSSSTPIISAHDPNGMTGPKGSGTRNCVGLGQQLPYGIIFTNLSTATAPAQQVVVTQQLDPNLDPRTFRLGNFGFSGMIFQVPANRSFYQTTLNLAQQLGFDVLVTATIDESTGIAKWIFTTIDLATGEIPLDPNMGFLPPNDSTGIGTAFVSYTIRANQNDQTGTVIAAQATVTFSNSPPLTTAPIFNTIDTGSGLTSTVAALPATETTNQFPVTWSGSDAANGSGLANFTIYVSDNGGPYTAWLTNTTLTQATYNGQSGHSYGFYSVAIGNDNNVQATPTQPQATTTVQGGQAASTTTVTSDQPTGSTYGQTVNFTATVSVSGGATPTGSVQFQVNGLNYGNPITPSGGIATLATSSLAVGTYTVTASYAGDNTSQPSTGTLSGGQTVNPAPLTITADNQSMVYGDTLPTLTASYNGFVNGDSPASLTTQASLSTVPATSAAGTYPINVSGATDPNYTITFSNGILTINPAVPTVTVTDAGGGYTGSPFPATATVAGIDGVAGSTLEGVGQTLTYYTGTTATGTPLPGAPSDPGTYTVSAAFPGSTDYQSASASTTFIIVPGGSLSGTLYQDPSGNGFGNQDLPWTTSQPVVSVNLYLNGGNSPVASTTTDNNGNYLFSNLPPGTYTVQEVVPTGWTLTAQTGASVVGTGQFASTGNNFADFQLVSLGGTAYNDLNGDGVQEAGEPGLSGLTITLTQNGTSLTTTTDSSGNYSFTGVGPGAYTLAETLPSGDIFTQPAAPYTYSGTPTGGVNVTGDNFGNFQLVTLSGTVFYDKNDNHKKDGGEPGISGVTIALDGTNAATTDKSGAYTISGIGPGSHTLTEAVPTGYIETSPAGDTFTFTAASGSNLKENFANDKPTKTVDNGQAGYSESGTGWATLNQGWNGTSRTHAKLIKLGKATATWDLGVLGGTKAELFVTWVPAADRNPGAVYQIINNGKVLRSVVVDQTKAPADAIYSSVSWKSLGIFTINGAQDTQIVLFAGRGGSVDADGALALKVGNSQILEADGNAAAGAVTPLTAQLLAPVVREAEDLWRASGLSAAQQTALAGADVEIAPLPGGQIGTTIDQTIWIDPSAGGFGWYINTNTYDPQVFRAVAGQEFQAVAGSAAAHEADLLTVVAHEFGHLLDLPDVDNLLHPYNLMDLELGLGTRRLPPTPADRSGNDGLAADAATAGIEQALPNRKGNSAPSANDILGQQDIRAGLWYAQGELATKPAQIPANPEPSKGLIVSTVVTTGSTSRGASLGAIDAAFASARRRPTALDDLVDSLARGLLS